MLTIWRFLDGNRAHEKQSAALVSGLCCCLGSDGVDCRDLDCRALRIVPWRRLPADLAGLPRPDLILGAGHRSHWAILRARNAFGGRSVVIMQPSLPLSWFDFVIAPEHDCPPPLDNVILTQGALAEPLPDFPLDENRALLLFGGPSRHFYWDGVKVAAAAEQLLKQPLQWVLSDSRRTPRDTLVQYAGRGELHPWQRCPPGWLAEQMARAGQIWVTGDSVSMLFEALQSRARVGVITLPSRKSRNKIRSAVQRLLDQGLVGEISDPDIALPTALSTASRGPLPRALGQPVACARALLRRCGWLPGPLTGVAGAADRGSGESEPGKTTALDGVTLPDSGI
ncbi:ELM1/GtrOC1 family putative glycosyltransferase [Microbulbifer bruguierae]|uniref:ELM1/GtrOC1 family putative glycosyltransferase n=1 Tax=Microbulbifer bruguierae TaxID=3029061 RepID=A0ABY8NBM5_9GAMM|nr:ELM1/GtrOC1 family putative glycosyltransferase [Microbulbifer bruguierae]WGL15987.1 ELM1/GtrOC1 family putative glycosyltransferase [Microbulbifer bruguierae]